MSLRVQQDVLGLQVSVDDVEGVEVAQRAGDLCCVEPGSGLQEAALPLKVVEQLEDKKTKRTEVILITHADITEISVSQTENYEHKYWEEIRRQEGLKV